MEKCFLYYRKLRKIGLAVFHCLEAEETTAAVQSK